MTVNAGVVRFAQAFVVQVPHNLADAVLTRLEVTRMPNQVAKGPHVAQVAFTREIAS